MISFCYSLSASWDNPLSEACYISADLLRRLYPDHRMRVLCDFETAIILEKKRLPFAEIGVEIVTVKVPATLKSSSIRSRYLKTRVRTVLTGNIVYIDCDALPFRRFDDLFSHDHSFAAVLDRNREFVRPYMPEWVKPIYEHFQWQYPLARYFNSGVMFLRDNEEMQELGRLWHEHWYTVYDKFGKHQDQPTLNATINELQIDTLTMPVQFNAMVDSSLFFARDAKIVHYFFNGRRNSFDPESLLQRLIDELKSNGQIDWSAYDEQIEQADPWIHPTKSVFKELVCNNYGEAAKVAMKRIKKKVWG